MDIKELIRESILDNWFRKHTLNTLMDRSAYSYNIHDMVRERGDDIIIWLKGLPNSTYNEENHQYVLNTVNKTLSVYGRGLNNEPDSVYNLTDVEYDGLYKKIYHLI